MSVSRFEWQSFDSGKKAFTNSAKLPPEILILYKYLRAFAVAWITSEVKV
jgi:hypothetical protein